jgi:hypothetical protein
MTGSQKPIRLVIVLMLAVAIGIVAMSWVPSRSGFATAPDCLAAYYEALQNGDVDAYLLCLADPLLSEMKRQAPSAAEWSATLRHMAVKNWVQDRLSSSEGKSVVIVVDEVRAEGTERVRFRLEEQAQGWRILDIKRLDRRRPPFPYGSDIRTAPEGQ